MCMLLSHFVTFTSVKIRTMMIEVSSEQQRIPLYIYIHMECCCRCCSCCSVLRYRCRCCSGSAATPCCCSSSCAGWPNLVLVHSIISLHLSAIHFFVPLGRFARILVNCGHERSRGGRHPTAAKPLFYIYYLCSMCPDVSLVSVCYRSCARSPRLFLHALQYVVDI